MQHNSAGIPSLAGYTGPCAQEHDLGVLLGVTPRVSHAVHEVTELLQAADEPIHVHRLLNVALDMKLRFRCSAVRKLMVDVI